MQEKLSVSKVFKNAGKYVCSHLFAFVFLVMFYFLGSLLLRFAGANFFKAFLIPYYYLFLYFAAGFYYKQRILLDGSIFLAAGVRFLKAIITFLAILLISTFFINILLNFIESSFIGGGVVVSLMVHSLIWTVCKYLYIFALFVVFFIIPSFSFVSEITSKSRSILTTFAKTKGNIIQIAVVAFLSFVLLLLTLIVCSFSGASSIIAELLRDIALVFISVVYFKMYDFFYKTPKSKTTKKDSSIVEPVVDNRPTKLAMIFGKIRKPIASDKKSVSVAVSEEGENNAHQG